MSDRVKGRIFLVGCPRSGTTLLQSLLATQPQVISFPETHYFGLPGIKRRHFWALRLGLVPPAMRKRMREQLQRFISALERPDLQPYLPSGGPWLRAYVKTFERLLDTLATEQNKTFWLEKTPSHLYFVDLIERYMAGVKVIHLVRNGPDVVASLYEVTRQFPQRWGGSYDLDRCIERWNEAVRLSERHLAKANHCLVSYEALVQRPEATVATLCRFLGVLFYRDALGHYRHGAAGLISKDEPWKNAVQGEIRDANGKKFDRLFTKEQQAYILHRLRPLPHATPVLSEEVYEDGFLMKGSA